MYYAFVSFSSGNFLSMLKFFYLVTHNDLSLQVFVQSIPWAKHKVLHLCDIFWEGIAQINTSEKNHLLLDFSGVTP